jgi:hypothetical protein
MSELKSRALHCKTTVENTLKSVESVVVPPTSVVFPLVSVLLIGRSLLFNLYFVSKVDKNFESLLSEKISSSLQGVLIPFLKTLSFF